MKIEKGGIASVAGIWYVIVNVYEKGGVPSFDCLCDHANNIHHFLADEAQYIASLREVHDLEYGNPTERFDELVRKRKIPYRVIVEVLSGFADDRFSHWGGRK